MVFFCYSLPYFVYKRRVFMGTDGKGGCKNRKTILFRFFCCIIKAHFKAFCTAFAAFLFIFKAFYKVKIVIHVIVTVKKRYVHYLTKSFLFQKAMFIFLTGMNIRIIKKHRYIKILRQILYNVRATRSATAMKREFFTFFHRIYILIKFNLVVNFNHLFINYIVKVIDFQGLEKV